MLCNDNIMRAELERLLMGCYFQIPANRPTDQALFAGESSHSYIFEKGNRGGGR